jgi:multidrug efflux pump
MTSMAFILGVLPLALASGAGSASQRAIGTGVIGGMLTAPVLLSVLFVPVFFVVVRSLFHGRKRKQGHLARLFCRPVAAPVDQHRTGQQP